MSSDKPLIAVIEAFLKRAGMSATRFGAVAVGDTKFVKTLREGRLPRDKTVATVLAFMRNYRG